MRYDNLSVLELRKLLDNKEITIEDLFNNSRELAIKLNGDYNNFVTILDKLEHSSNKNSLLNGIPYALKDNFSTKDILTTASSNILKDYIPVYNSTVYQKLIDAGCVLVGKTTLDELAMGGTGTTCHTGVVRNIWDKKRMVGGSSSGSANAVASGIVPFALGSDTGDSVRKPASYVGVIGFKPTYGRISRYGLFAFASSLDHVGIFARNVKDVAIVTDVLKGKDTNDMTSLEDDNINYLDNEIKGRKLFYIKEVINIKTNNKETDEIIKNFKENIDKLRELGFIIEEVSIDKKLLEAVYPTYNIISCAEATSNNANLTGILYGPRSDKDNINDMIFDARTKGFSELIKRRFVIGSYVLQKENQEKLFLNACRVRRIIVDKINDLFKKYDGYILPACGTVAPLLEDASDKLTEEYLILENHLQIGNFGGFPSITIPCGYVNNMPISINLTGRAKEDSLVLNMAYHISNKLGNHDIIARRDNDV
ncbi:MAG: aspartyl/glutamyl-tRNA amidotransferase subunit A [Tenericutes bacterium]|nr:aspartyl/glutamyl-tRNA amidotransferase subunit A [Mycoplasmatota bacterium]